MATRTPLSPAGYRVREYQRLPVQGSMYFSTDESIGTGLICNVSLGGWAVRSNTPVKSGASVTLFATLPDHKQVILVDQAKVCWTTCHEFGLAIRKIAPQDAERLKDFITSPQLV